MVASSRGSEEVYLRLLPLFFSLGFLFLDGSKGTGAESVARKLLPSKRDARDSLERAGRLSSAFLWGMVSLPLGKNRLRRRSSFANTDP
jgi:hypothetical protein